MLVYQRVAGSPMVVAEFPMAVAESPPRQQGSAILGGMWQHHIGDAGAGSCGSNGLVTNHHVSIVLLSIVCFFW